MLCYTCAASVLVTVLVVFDVDVTQDAAPTVAVVVNFAAATLSSVVVGTIGVSVLVTVLVVFDVVVTFGVSVFVTIVVMCI